VTLRDELDALDAARFCAAFDGVFDKCTSFEETGVMVDLLAEGFPAADALISHLRLRVAEELDDETARLYCVLGAALVLLTFDDCARTEQLRRQFPDVSQS
jgi:hypothetical protein